MTTKASPPDEETQEEGNPFADARINLVPYVEVEAILTEYSGPKVTGPVFEYLNSKQITANPIDVAAIKELQAFDRGIAADLSTIRNFLERIEDKLTAFLEKEPNEGFDEKMKAIFSGLKKIVALNPDAKELTERIEFSLAKVSLMELLEEAATVFDDNTIGVGAVAENIDGRIDAIVQEAVDAHKEYLEGQTRLEEAFLREVIERLAHFGHLSGGYSTFEDLPVTDQADLRSLLPG